MRHRLLRLALSTALVGCMRSTRDSFVVATSNMPTGDLAYRDADYEFRLTKTK